MVNYNISDFRVLTHLEIRILIYRKINLEIYNDTIYSFFWNEGSYIKLYGKIL